jgi:3-hydroxybutyrate dehydrogenase
VRDPEQVDAVVARAHDEFGRVDVLINNAGYERLTHILESGSEVEDIFRRIIDVNILGTYYVTREAVSRMVSGSRIVITASVWGKTGMAGFTAYCASKHANIGFMRALADELGPRGITVNAVCPGWVRTDAAMRSLSIMASNESRSEEDCLNDILSAQAIEGLMEPDDVASTYLFLASDQACNITGQALNVDRGELLT